MATSKMDPQTLMLEADDGDFLRELIRSAAQRLMELEVERVAGAGYRERSGERHAHRNGYRQRAWQTRAGEVGLQIPKLRRASDGRLRKLPLAPAMKA